MSNRKRGAHSGWARRRNGGRPLDRFPNFDMPPGVELKSEDIESALAQRRLEDQP